MAIRGIPASGLSLSYADPQQKDDIPSQIVRLDLAQDKFRDILAQLKNGNKVSLQTGKQAAVQYGGDKLLLDASSEAFPAEIYSRSVDDKGKMFFSGKLSLHLEMQKAREATAGSDAALAVLQNTLTSMKEEQMNNEASIFGTKSGKGVKPMQSRKDLLSAAPSRPSSPFLGSAFSPAIGPTSNPLLGSGSNTKDRMRFEAMKVPVMHLLASRPMTCTAIAEKIRAPRSECERLLDKIARDTPTSAEKKELKDKTYRDLDVWKFRYPSEEDRQAAIERAILAFDRMRIEKTDNLWQMLLKTEERGKGKTLSRLNFDKPAPAPKPASTQKKTETSDDAEASHLSAKKATTKTGEKKSHKEPQTKSRAVSPPPPKREPVGRRGPTTDNKFKSSERVEDSDDEASTVEVIPRQPLKKKEKENPPLMTKAKDRVSSPASKKPTHKASTSSSSSTSENSDTSQAKKSLKPPSNENNSTSKKSPRARHGSSPQKPSPLGSSPPANSTDFDSSSSTTTKGTSQSSAPSSPPSGNEMPVSKQKQKYSPVVGDRARDVSQNSLPAKRKQDESGSVPPAKRHQVNGVHTKATNGTPKALERPTLARKVSESERSSSPEKPGQARDDVLDRAKQFQLYYKKYKNLHDKISRTPEKDRDGVDTDKLWEMHKRLKEMKTEIWSSWDKVERTVAE
jgi:RNA polymerase II elongation factor ELL